MAKTIKSLKSDVKHKYSIMSLFIILSLFLIVVFNVSSYATSNSEAIIDSVNIGDSSDETGHSLFGFGPIEPATHGGGWGGADDGNLRVIWYNDSANPSDIPTQSPDENYASAQLSIPNNYIPTKIQIRALDGIADDSFEIYINNDLVYSYLDEGSTETWKTHEIDVSSIELTGSIEIKIKSTSPKWSSFDTYGQLGISGISLYGVEGKYVTVKLIDSKNNTLEDGYVEYYKNGWKEFGITDSNGEITKLIPKGTYTFKMTYLGASVSLKQDVSVDPVVVFSTVEVTVRLQSSNGTDISGGNVSFSSGGWKDFGITGLDGNVTKELLPKTYTFRLIYDGSSVSIKQDISTDSTVTFSTIEVTVLFKDSIGNVISGGNVSYYSGSWKHFGFTDVNGSVSGEFLPRVYTFRMTYLDASVSLKQDVGVDQVVVFSTIDVTVGFFDSIGNPLGNATVEFSSGGWKDFGITGLDGNVTKELLPKTYTFRLIYDGSSVSKKQDVSIDSIVIFNTINVTIKLKDSIGLSLSDGDINYYSAGWKYLGITNNNGSVYGEFLPRIYTFKVTYDGSSVSFKQDVSVDPVVVFSTVEVTVKLESSNNSPLIDGNVSYYSAGWKFFGFTNSSGVVKKELLPVTYTFKMGYDESYISKKQDVASDSLVVFSTIEVTVLFKDSIGNVISGGNVSYYSGSWKHFGFTDVNGSVSGEFLPRVYTFRMTYLDASVSLKQDVSVDPVVVFSTVEATVRLQSSNGTAISGGNVSFSSGGWKDFGITGLDGNVTKELLPKVYTFRVLYDGSSVSMKQDISIDSTVIFSKIEVTVILQDRIGNPLSNGSVNYYSAGWKFFGITDSNGEAKNELLPRTFTFRAIYNGTRYTTKQNIGENSIVIIKTDTIDNYPPMADSNGPYSGYKDQVIKFDGSKSYDPDGSIVNYTWDFGDGSVGYSAKTEHTYTQVGDYIVNLTVRDNEGLSNYNITYAKITVKQTIAAVNNNHRTSYNTVTSNHNSEGTVDEETVDEKPNSPPVAKAVFKVKSDEEDSLSFDASESCDPDGDELYYRWDFDSNGEWDTEYSKDPFVTYKYSHSNLNGQVRVEVFDGEKSDETTITYIIESHVEQLKEIGSQESSSGKQYYLFVEWWFIFISVICSLVVVLYIYKKRFLIIKKIKSSCLITVKKQKRMGKLVSVIFKLLCM